MANENRPITKPLKRTIGQAVAKCQRALDALLAAEDRRRELFKKERAELQRAAAVEAARLRHAAREQRRQLEQQFASRLGRMALAKLRRQGLVGTLLTADDIGTWPEQDRSGLVNLLLHQLDIYSVSHNEAISIAEAGNGDITLDL